MGSARNRKSEFGLWKCYTAATVVIVLAVAALAFVTSQCFAGESQLSKDARINAAKELIGRDVFACQTAQFYLYTPKSPLGLPIGARVPYFPLLTPMKIVDVIPSVSSELVQGLLIVVKPPSQEEMLFKADLPLAGPLQQGVELLKNLASGDFGGVKVEIPSSFSRDEVESIKYHVVSRGMTEAEVTCALGFPESTNDYGRAGKQLVYLGGRELIYVDSDSGRVTDIQHFEQ